MLDPVATSLAVKIDSKGRLTIPRRLRANLGIGPGDTLFVEFDQERKMLCYAKAENPFDELAEHALQEHRTGRTRGLRDFAAENNIGLDAG